MKGLFYDCYVLDSEVQRSYLYHHFICNCLNQTDLSYGPITHREKALCLPDVSQEIQVDSQMYSGARVQNPIVLDPICSFVFCSQ